VRTDSDAPKHKGITTMVVDMTATGVTVRPLREMTGEAFFSEVFLDDVFVSDDDVVGDVNAGWVVARATLGNERVSIGGDVPPRMTSLELLQFEGADLRVDSADEQIGALIAAEHVLRAMNLRQIERVLVDADVGAVGTLIKHAKAEHTQQVTECAMTLLGSSGADGRAAQHAWTYLMCRALTIAGGTSEVSRNVIAERLLGLPRDPLTR
jgi:alkylation response protein AidB-like acyl-CoA dehydrogenase